ncbi:hypothetical protein Pmar_PMAR017310 [Perkinsus marinus ATCC 50983]|uniref:Uncharacterized protein n=1 Tax=Perkinsus marinus (strain ATCC 50983 / TXsc) TaxID=423536 RepID=C5LH87_PERM5|nr:hypothetical protein Pmar_PMAR017310 [Perkinsus marinus ATCC 50983]EER03896.1 hypothetical protein Pmar_PMAR017310 [Perkinsus marinus ATCC 50983]|eukprot:XP_002772080.1 hypothetical protein Pmar_PMAR017310 [Perkinsus marinus ATCC 50983]
MLCNYLSSALISLVYEKDVTEHMMERAGVSAEGAHFELTDVSELCDEGSHSGSPQDDSNEHVSRISGRSVHWGASAVIGGSTHAVNNPQQSSRPMSTDLDSGVLASTVIIRDTSPRNSDRSAH